MITVRDVDRLVISDDAIAARAWPGLGDRVRTAYTTDRENWVALRRKNEAGETLPQATLVAQQQVFSGWARAFRAAVVGRPKHAPTAVTKSRRLAPGRSTSSARAPMVPGPVAARSPASAPAVRPSPSTPLTSHAGVGAGTAVAGTLILASLVAVAARRRRP